MFTIDQKLINDYSILEDLHYNVLSKLNWAIFASFTHKSGYIATKDSESGKRFRTVRQCMIGALSEINFRLNDLYFYISDEKGFNTRKFVNPDIYHNHCLVGVKSARPFPVKLFCNKLKKHYQGFWRKPFSTWNQNKYGDGISIGRTIGRNEPSKYGTAAIEPYSYKLHNLKGVSYVSDHIHEIYEGKYYVFRNDTHISKNLRKMCPNLTTTKS